MCELYFEERPDLTLVLTNTVLKQHDIPHVACLTRHPPVAQALREAEARLQAENKDLVRQQELNLEMSEQQASRMTRRLSRTMSSTVQATARLSLA